MESCGEGAPWTSTGPVGVGGPASTLTLNPANLLGTRVSHREPQRRKNYLTSDACALTDEQAANLAVKHARRTSWGYVHAGGCGARPRTLRLLVIKYSYPLQPNKMA
ncbi:hypothetical protein NDU88_006929 [Pleurodeles waltl]|uniref:Uncharacterized protein n=1 Tax=Pleurodeles waltl TaxID=8319 RepID=A0AAV7U1Z5_PLEWA|nr:hypothetical protein NDU88_006929 [Pleurodeles waltl]